MELRVEAHEAFELEPAVGDAQDARRGALERVGGLAQPPSEGREIQ
jgi:hypothetical protein